MDSSNRITVPNTGHPRQLQTWALRALQAPPDTRRAPEEVTTANSMDERMALYMPEQMRAIRLAMHTSASEFAVVTSRTAMTHDAKAALEALSPVTQNCVACHAGYHGEPTRAAIARICCVDS